MIAPKKHFILLTVIILSIIFIANFTYAEGGIQIPNNTGLPDGTVTEVLDRTVNWLLKIFVIIAVTSFVITGLQFIFSFGGSTGSQEQAKKNLTYTIIAIFIVGGALIIFKSILTLLGPSTGVSSSGNSSGITNQQLPNFDFFTPDDGSDGDNMGEDGGANPNGNQYGTQIPDSNFFTPDDGSDGDNMGEDGGANPNGNQYGR